MGATHAVGDDASVKHPLAQARVALTPGAEPNWHEHESPTTPPFSVQQAPRQSPQSQGWSELTTMAHSDRWVVRALTRWLPVSMTLPVCGCQSPLDSEASNRESAGAPSSCDGA
jgi:hypothetical protein